MRAEDHRGAGRRARGDRLAHPPHPARIEASERLVENQRRRLVQQAAGDGELLSHAARQLARQRAPLVLSSSSASNGRIRAFDVGDAVQPRDEPQMLLDR